MASRDEAVGVAAVHLELDEVEECALALPAPAHIDHAAAAFELELGLEGGEVGAGERFAEGGVVAGVGLDLFDQGAEADLDAKADRGDGGGKTGTMGMPVGGGVPPPRARSPENDAQARHWGFPAPGSAGTAPSVEGGSA